MLKTFTVRLFSIAALMLVLSADFVQAAEPVAYIKISFKLDPRLTLSMYMGERWVSPPVFSMVEDDDGKLVVEARAQAFDAKGMPVDLNLKWTPSNPEMLKVAADTGKQAAIEILKEGESFLTVSGGGISKKLGVAASRVEGSLQVEISQ